MKIAISFFLSLITFYSLEASDRDFIKDSNLKEASIFASQIEQTLANGNPVYFNSYFNTDLFLDKILNKSNQNADIAGYNYGFSNGFSQNFDLGSVIINELQKGGKYDFLSTYISKGKTRLLFRLFSMQGINYHEIELTKVDNIYQISDVYIYVAGEYLSESIKRIYILDLAENRALKSLNPEGEKMQAFQSKYEKAMMQFGAAKFDKAYNIWEKSAKDYESNRYVLLMGIQFASYNNIQQYRTLSDKYSKLYPKDPGYYLLSLDGLMHLGEYKQALSALNLLDNAVGSDPFLNYLRSTICFSMNNNEMAISYLKRLVNEIPDFDMAYYSLLDYYIREAKYDQATNILDQMSKAFNVYKEDLEQLLKEYPSFIASSEYTDWIGK